MNEPQCFVGLGFLTGEHAPGVKVPLRDTFEMAHNAMKAHGRAVQMLRAYGKQKLMIGCAPTSSVCYPETDHPEDIEAARKAYFSLHEDVCVGDRSSYMKDIISQFTSQRTDYPAMM